MKKLLLLLIFMFAILGYGLLGGQLISAGAEDQGNNKYYKYYTSIRIGRGDSLWSIARKYNINSGRSDEEYIEELKSINRLGEKPIHEGNYLAIVYYSDELK